MNKSMTGEEMIRTWAKHAQSSEILTMTETELADFAAKNLLAIYEIRVSTRREVIGWRLYKTIPDPADAKGEARTPDKLYYVVRNAKI